MITWTEIPCTDLERIQTFYSTVFGWNVTPSLGGSEDFSMFTKGATHGSFIKLDPHNFLSPGIHPENPDAARIALRVTINVESVDEKLKEIEKAGGSLYMYVTPSFHHFCGRALISMKHTARRRPSQVTWALLPISSTPRRTLWVSGL
jgi:uncharacterized protein